MKKIFLYFSVSQVFLRFIPVKIAITPRMGHNTVCVTTRRHTTRPQGTNLFMLPSQQSAQQGEQKLPDCKLPSCQKTVYVDRTGVQHEFCGAHGGGMESFQYFETVKNRPDKKPVQWMAVKIFILEKRLKEHTDKMEQMERMMDPKATMDSLDKSAANIRSLEKSVASAAEISVSVNPLLDSLARMENRILELENRPPPQQDCCVVS